MLKFTMNSKELKKMIDKGVAAINKKLKTPALTRLYFQVDANGIVKILGTDYDHYAEIRNDSAWDTSPGVLGIDVDDLNIITKMNGNITLEDISTEKENKISVKVGNKCITIPRYENVDIFLPSIDETEKCILSVKESWLLDTIVSLFTHTSDNESNKMMQVFNFNTGNKRVEVLDGHRIGMRSLNNREIEKENESMLLHRKCMPVFKKLLDKKSDNRIKMYQDKKYIRIEGDNFTYIIKRINGQYFKVEQMLLKDYEYSFNVVKEDILNVMKYDCDLLKSDEVKKPVVLHSEEGILYTYLRTARYEAFDVVDTISNCMKDDFYIGFDPNYLAEAFSIVDSENPLCQGVNNKGPLMIYGEEYSFLVLPVNIKDLNIEENMNACITRNKAA